MAKPDENRYVITIAIQNVPKAVALGIAKHFQILLRTRFGVTSTVTTAHVKDIESTFGSPRGHLRMEDDSTLAGGFGNTTQLEWPLVIRR
jgi:hypothetical protein